MLRTLSARPAHITWARWLRGTQCRRRFSGPSKTIDVLGTSYPTDRHTNVTPAILARLNSRLLSKPTHPLATLKSLIESHFADFTHFDFAADRSPLVTPKQNFDDLSFPFNHPGRAVTDSYYVNGKLMLRTHTSAHEVEVFAKGCRKWLLTADVFRRDEIDASHYPIFHQMEGARLFKNDRAESSPALVEENERLLSELSAENVQLEDKTHVDAENPYQPYHDPHLADLITQNLKYSLSLLLFKLFAGAAGASKFKPLQIRWIPAFFPFTSPSYEVEVLFRDKWLEILGCGVIQQATLTNAKVENEIGWAFGLGLERIAMILYQIPDIRLFWSDDHRFLGQFKPGQIKPFKPFSKYPSMTRDISFWCPKRSKYHLNNFCDIVRVVAGDLVEEVTLIDKFWSKHLNMESHCFRIKFRSMERNLERIEVNVLVNIIKERVIEELGVVIR